MSDNFVSALVLEIVGYLREDNCSSKEVANSNKPVSSKAQRRSVGPLPRWRKLMLQIALVDVFTSFAGVSSGKFIIGADGLLTCRTIVL